jgi:heat-inducible transcriptional repressor
MSPALDASDERELTERQRLILEYVVEDYVAGGLPVGSKALTARRSMLVSASTVRYELAELEDRGFLTHPHTSAGRVPTDLGYRFYVDRLLGSLTPRPAELALDLSSVRNEIEEGLQATIDALAQVTHLLALATAPQLQTTIVRHVEVLLLQPQVVVVVIITSTGGVTKRLVVFDEPVDPGLADWAATYLKETVAGLRLGARQLGARLADATLSVRERDFLAVLEPAFTELVESGDQGVYLGGAAGLVEELRADDITTFRGLLETLERRAVLLDLLRFALEAKRPFVRVGSEFADPAFAKLALVAAPYGLSNRNLGTVSLLGPARMDYGKAIDAVRSAAGQLSRFVEELYEE